MVSPMLKQCWISFGLFLNFFCIGTVMSYSSSLLPGLRAGDSTIRVDLDTASWLASGVGIPMFFGFLLAPAFMERFGRRWVFASSSLLLIMAWLMIYWANDVTTLMVGRLLGGVAVGISYCAGCTTLAEYTAPEIRGLLLNMKTGILYSGYLYMHIVGNFLHWRKVALLSAVPSFISILNNLTWPESPAWLATKNRFQECEESFFWLRGRNDKAVKELEAIVRAQKSRMSQAPNTVSFTQRFVNFFKQFKQKSLLKPLAIVFFGSILCEASGRHFFPAYAVDIITEVTNDKSNSLYYIIGVDIVSLASAVASCILIKVIGRKTLLLFSGITSTALLSGIALLTFLVSKGCSVVGHPWLVPSLVGLFFVLANLGCTAIPYVIYGEIFPMAHRESGAGLGGALMSFSLFIFMKVLPYLLTNLKLYGTFAVFAVGMTVSLVYLHFAMPETRNRTLQEIEDFFEHGRFLDDEDRGPSGDVAEGKCAQKENNVHPLSFVSTD